MLDLQVVKSRQSLPIRDIKTVPGVTPAVLDVRVANLTSVNEVRINDIRSPSVMIVSSRQLLAQLPDEISDVSFVRTVEVLTNLPITLEPAKLFMEIGRTPVDVEGIQKLVQLVIKVLLTSPGRDLFDPQVGGGFLRQIGRNISLNNVSVLMTDLSVGITRTLTQIIESQSQDPAIPDDERLLSLDIVDAVFDAESASVFVALRVESVAGPEAVARLFL
jgi:hypothetical protein